MPRKRQDRDVARARKLRREMTLPEVLIWRILRTRPEGIKFRRQHAIGDYVLDFYCPKAKLGIEIDGVAHDMGENPKRDDCRDAWLREQGIDVLHVPAREVLKSARDAADAIMSVCRMC